MRNNRRPSPEQPQAAPVKDFFDMILPGVVKFLPDHYLVGDSYRCVWAVREYLLENIFSRAKGIDAQALLAQQLRDATDQSAARLKQAQAEHAKAARELERWAKLFADATPDEKKLVAANLIRAVRLTRNYGIEVDFNISEAQYLNGLEME